MINRTDAITEPYLFKIAVEESIISLLATESDGFGQIESSSVRKMLGPRHNKCFSLFRRASQWSPIKWMKGWAADVLLLQLSTDVSGWPRFEPILLKIRCSRLLSRLLYPFPERFLIFILQSFCLSRFWVFRLEAWMSRWVWIVEDVVCNVDRLLPQMSRTLRYSDPGHVEQSFNDFVRRCLESMGEREVSISFSRKLACSTTMLLVFHRRLWGLISIFVLLEVSRVESIVRTLRYPLANDRYVFLYSKLMESLVSFPQFYIFWITGN